MARPDVEAFLPPTPDQGVDTVKDAVGLLIQKTGELAMKPGEFMRDFGADLQKREV